MNDLRDFIGKIVFKARTLKTILRENALRAYSELPSSAKDIPSPKEFPEYVTTAQHIKFVCDPRSSGKFIVGIPNDARLLMGLV